MKVKKDIKGRLFATLLWIVTSVIGFLILALMFNVIVDKLLRAGFIEYAGTSQFLRVFFGWPLFGLASFAWLALFIWSGQFYTDGLDRDLMISRFFLVTAGEMICFPLIVLLYQVVYSIGMTRFDWIIAYSGLFLWSLSLFLLFVLPGKVKIIMRLKGQKYFKYCLLSMSIIFFLLLLCVVVNP